MGGRIRETHRPLYAEQPEEEGQARVPPACLVDDTVGAENVRCGVHLRSRGHRQEDDDNNYSGARRQLMGRKGERGVS